MTLIAQLTQSLRARLGAASDSINSLSGVYNSFAEANRAAPRSKALGYDAADSASWYNSKLNGVSQEDYPVVFWLREAFAGGRSIFEIGGHVGVAYYGFERILPYPNDLIWTICDVPSVVEAGKALAQKKGRSNLHFVTSPGQSKGADILIACGSLQYLDSPGIIDILGGFHHQPKHVLINTTPVYDGAAYITLQNLGTAYCPYRIFNRRELIKGMSSLGYTLVDTWQKERKVLIPGHPDKSFDHYSGFYFRKA